ncbi:MAG: hypothetical protein NTU83_10480 [Candidatus Hydrogenedentes bacterium]|nr:hypothetical protein [Candidatus Hydrogenedentota bacterium]
MCEEDVVFEFVDRNGLQVAVQTGQEIADQVVRQRPRGRLAKEDNLNRAGFGGTHDDRQYTVFIAQQDNRQRLLVLLTDADKFKRYHSHPSFRTRQTAIP